jgi:hypothetical protein
MLIVQGFWTLYTAQYYEHGTTSWKLHPSSGEEILARTVAYCHFRVSSYVTRIVLAILFLFLILGLVLWVCLWFKVSRSHCGENDDDSLLMIEAVRISETSVSL